MFSNAAAKSLKADGVPSNAMFPNAVDSNSFAATPSKKPGSGRKPSQFRGNKNSVSPAVESTLLAERMKSPEKVSIAELKGKGKLIYKDSKEYKKYYNRKATHERIQNENPEEIIRLCHVYGVPVSDDFVKMVAMLKLAKAKLVSDTSFSATAFGDADEDRENVAPSKTSRALFHQKEDKNIQVGKPVFGDSKNKATNEDYGVEELTSAMGEVKIVGEAKGDIDEATDEIEEAMHEMKKAQNKFEAATNKLKEANATIEYSTENIYLHAEEMKMKNEK